LAGPRELKLAISSLPGMPETAPTAMTFFAAPRHRRCRTDTGDWWRCSAVFSHPAGAPSHGLVPLQNAGQSVPLLFLRVAEDLVVIDVALVVDVAMLARSPS
jgi:hypothetical protein